MNTSRKRHVIKLEIYSRWMIEEGLAYCRYEVIHFTDSRSGKVIFRTNQKAKLMIWLDLNGLRILFNTRETWVSDRRQVFGFIAQSLRRPSSNTSERLTTECIAKIKIKLGQANGRNHDKRGKRRAERA